jgi:hypothetical protein
MDSRWPARHRIAVALTDRSSRRRPHSRSRWPPAGDTFSYSTASGARRAGERPKGGNTHAGGQVTPILVRPAPHRRGAGVARRDRNVRSDKTRAASWRGSCTHLLSWKGPEPSEGYSIFRGGHTLDPVRRRNRYREIPGSAPHSRRSDAPSWRDVALRVAVSDAGDACGEGCRPLSISPRG